MRPLPRSASVRAPKIAPQICVSAANLYKVYAQDLKQFALMQMNLAGVSRRLRERITTIRRQDGKPGSDIEHFFMVG